MADEQDSDISISGLGAKLNPSYVVGPEVAHGLEQTQINKFHTKAGFGFAAEDANTFADRVRGHTVEQVGTGNSLNGPDRLVDGIAIQSKYCKSPGSTIESAFGKDQVYRYTGQRLEVPNDQYDGCIALMRRKIEEGKVPGFTNPDDAERIIQKGHVTYQQAVNIAKAGTIDGLVYDAKTHAVGAGFTFSLSFVVQFAQLKWSGQSTEDALWDATVAGLGTGVMSMATGVITAQVLRTKAAAAGVVVSRNAVRAIAKSKVGKVVVEKVALASLGKAVHGGAAINHVAKLARSNVVAGTVATTVMAAPDFYRAAIQKNISWAQFGKNTAVNAAGVAAGAGGWMAGAALGAAAGSAVPGLGTVVGAGVGGIIGSISAGSAGSFGTKKLLDTFVKDDAQEVLDALPDYLGPLLAEYMLTDKEFASFRETLTKKLTPAYMREIYVARFPAMFVVREFEPVCIEIVNARPKVGLPTEAEVAQELIRVLDAAEAEAEAEAEADEEAEASPQESAVLEVAGTIER